MQPSWSHHDRWCHRPCDKADQTFPRSEASTAAWARRLQEGDFTLHTVQWLMKKAALRQDAICSAIIPQHCVGLYFGLPL